MYVGHKVWGVASELHDSLFVTWNGSQDQNCDPPFLPFVALQRIISLSRFGRSRLVESFSMYREEF
jgi:hypothetical protein